MKQLSLPPPPSLERWPELAPLAILHAALSTSESALLAVCPEIHCDTIGRASRGSTVVRTSTETPPTRCGRPQILNADTERRTVES